MTPGLNQSNECLQNDDIHLTRDEKDGTTLCYPKGLTLHLAIFRGPKKSGHKVNMETQIHQLVICLEGVNNA